MENRVMGNLRERAARIVVYSRSDGSGFEHAGERLALVIIRRPSADSLGDLTEEPQADVGAAGEREGASGNDAKIRAPHHHRDRHERAPMLDVAHGGSQPGQ